MVMSVQHRYAVAMRVVTEGLAICLLTLSLLLLQTLVPRSHHMEGLHCVTPQPSVSAAFSACQTEHLCITVSVFMLCVVFQTESRDVWKGLTSLSGETPAHRTQTWHTLAGTLPFKTKKKKTLPERDMLANTGAFSLLFNCILIPYTFSKQTWTIRESGWESTTDTCFFY